VLEAIGTWDMQEDIILKCENNNQAGSDLNNDGYDDYILATWDNFYFFMGGEELNDTYDFVLEGASSTGCVSWGGDLNGDGYKDIVYSRAVDWGDPGDVYICLGGEEIDVEPELILQGEDYVPDPYALNYHGYNGGYDFNGDGYDDLLTWGDGPSLWWNGLIQIFFGGDELSTEPDFQIQGGIEEFFGYYWAVCDINGDGFDDLIASRNEGFEGPADFELYLGGEYMDIYCDYILLEDWWGDGDCFATGDYNGDSIEELIIGNGPNGAIGSYYLNSESEIIFEQHYLELLGHIRTANINGDNYDDIVSWNCSQDIITVYYGNPESNYEYDIIYQSENITTSYFWCIIGDINCDGEDEILINNRENEAELGNTATIYSVPVNENNESTIEKVKCKMCNYPNPFNPVTTISYTLQENVTNPVIGIFNIKGQLVIKLRMKDEGLRTNSVVWDGRDNNRNQVSSGIYLCSLIDDGKVLASQKMILLK
jgi:hypothetical protein